MIISAEGNYAVCPECKKHFGTTEEWVYKYGKRFFCSWTCYRAAEKRRAEQARQRRRTDSQRYDLDELTRRLQQGESLRRIAEEYGTTYPALQSWVKRQREKRQEDAGEVSTDEND